MLRIRVDDQSEAEIALHRQDGRRQRSGDNDVVLRFHHGLSVGARRRRQQIC